MLGCLLDRCETFVALLLLPDHVHELLKADVGVMGAWGRLRVVLDGHGPLASVHHASTGAIIQVDVGNLHLLRESGGVHGVVVVL